jgi:hypothetical protein
MHFLFSFKTFFCKFHPPPLNETLGPLIPYPFNKKESNSLEKRFYFSFGSGALESGPAQSVFPPCLK